MMNLARTGNKYFNDSQPWITIKNNEQQCANTINICLQTIFSLAEFMQPVIPFTSVKIFKMLNAEAVTWQNCNGKNLPSGHKLNASEILFSKIEDETIDKQFEKLGNNKNQNRKEAQISLDEFSKVQLKVALVKNAEKINQSKKLLKLDVELNKEQRTIVAGIAKNYSPEDIVGKHIIIVANLQPVKLFGIESQGMVLSVENSKGDLEVVTVDSSVKSGTKVR